jgi:capsular exopolysaccharide synthesis family protein
MTTPNGGGPASPSGNGLGFSRLTPREGQIGAASATPVPATGGTPNSSQPQKRRRKAVESKLNFNEIIKMLYRGRWIILGMFVLFFTYSVYNTYNKPVIFGAGTRLLIEKPPISEKELGPLFSQREDHSIANQIQFFKSHVVAEHVARVIHKYAQGDRGEIDSLFTEYFKNKDAVPPDPGQIAVIRLVDNPKAEQVKGLADVATIRGRVAAAINIFPEPNNDYLSVAAEAYTPLDAALIVNTYIVVFAKDNLARLRHNNILLKEFIASQKSRSYDTLSKIESELQANMSDGMGLDIESRAGELWKQYEDFHARNARLAVAMQQRRNILEKLERSLDSAKLSLTNDLVEEPVIQGLQQQIVASEIEIMMQKSQNAVMNPRTKKYFNDDMKSREDRLAKLKEELNAKADYLINSQKIYVTDVNDRGEQQQQTIVSPTQAVLKLKEAVARNQLALQQDSLEMSSYDSLMKARKRDIEALPGLLGRVNSLRRAAESAERIYSQMEGKYMDAWFNEQSVFSNVKVEDPAGLSATPIRPNRQADIFLGSLIGLAAGVGVVILIAMMDSTVRSPEELESNGLNVLAAIPVIGQLGSEEAAAAALEGRPKFTPHRVSHLDPRSSIAESYRSLRTTLQFAGLDHPIRTIAVSSSAPQEGKSTTSSNLGIVMSQMGKRTLIVDTDLRRPVLHSVFGMNREPGLTNVLFDRTSLEDAIKATDVPNLFVLPCGIIPPNPAELLGSEKMNKLIQTLKEQFDFIIFDTPPVVAVTDALLLGMQTDALMLIARADVSKSDGVLRAVDAVERSGIRFLGVVLNNFNVANAYGAYYRYYQYYHYYSNEGAPKSSWLSRAATSLSKKIKMPEKEHTHSHNGNGEHKHHSKRSKEHV